MKHALAGLKKRNCVKCGKEIMVSGTKYCEVCKREMEREYTKKLIEVGKKIDKDDAWKKNWLPWNMLGLIPLILFILALLASIMWLLSQ